MLYVVSTSHDDVSRCATSYGDKLHTAFFFIGARPSIKPDTILSFGASKDNNTKPDEQSPSASQQDAVVPSSTKKLTSKMNQSDKVLTYLKASVRVLTVVCWKLFPFVTKHLWVAKHSVIFCEQDAAAKEMHDKNKVMKKQLIGLLAKVN